MAEESDDDEAQEMEETTEEEETPQNEYEEEAQVEDEISTVEEEIEPSPAEEVEEEIVEERFYTVSLGKAWITPSNKRVPRAIRILKDFVKRHMKLRDQREPMEEEEEGGRLTISNEVNQRIWSRGIKKPPRKVRVRVTRDKEGNVAVHLAEGD